MCLIFAMYHVSFGHSYNTDCQNMHVQVIGAAHRAC